MGTTGPYIEGGVIDGDVTNSLEWSDVQVSSGNAGIIAKRMKEMKIKGKTTLITKDPEFIALVSGGIISKSIDAAVTAASIGEVKTASTNTGDTTLAASGTYTGRTGTIRAKVTTAGALGGTGKVLVTFYPTDGSEVTLGTFAPTSATAITLSNGVTLTFTVGTGAALVLGDIYEVPVVGKSAAITHLKGGTSTFTFKPLDIHFSHVDSTGLVRGCKIFNATPSSGAFQFNFLGQTTDGAEKIEFSYEASIDQSRADGEQLFDVYSEDGAE
jgi:hypothetical protein